MVEELLFLRVTVWVRTLVVVLVTVLVRLLDEATAGTPMVATLDVMDGAELDATTGMLVTSGMLAAEELQSQAVVIVLMTVLGSSRTIG